MTEVQRLPAICPPDDCEGERGERGKRGHRGATGPTGPTGPNAPSGLLKFSGEIGFDPNAAVITFLADTGNADITNLAGPVDYPIAIARSLRNLATNLKDYIVQPGQSITFELLQNGVAVPGFTTVYAPGETGIKTVAIGPTAFAIGDTFDLRITAVNVDAGVGGSILVAATIGVE